MKYQPTMEQMRDQLMITLEQDEDYKIVNLLTEEIMESKVDEEIKENVDIIRRHANVAINRSFIGNVLIFDKAKNTAKDFFDYKNDFETLEDLCVRQMIEEDKDL